MLPTSQLKSGAGYLVQPRSGLPVRCVHQAAGQLGSSGWGTWHVPCPQYALALRLEGLQRDTPLLLALDGCRARRGTQRSCRQSTCSLGAPRAHRTPACQMLQRLP